MNFTPTEADHPPNPIPEHELRDRRASAQASRAARARHVSGRRRFIDPATCERDYSYAETEFMLAMEIYKRESRRMFPTWSEVLEVIRGLGYEKPDPSGPEDWSGNPE